MLPGLLTALAAAFLCLRAFSSHQSLPSCSWGRLGCRLQEHDGTKNWWKWVYKSPSPHPFSWITLQCVFYLGLQNSPVGSAPVTYSADFLDKKSPFWLPSLLYHAFLDHLPCKLLALKSSSQGLLLRKPKLRLVVCQGDWIKQTEYSCLCSHTQLPEHFQFGLEGFSL